MTQNQGTKVNIAGQLKAELGNTFAGVWFDNRTGQFVVPIASPPSAPLVAQSRSAIVRQEFEAAGLTDDFRIEFVDFSRSDLVTAQLTLDARLSGFFADGLVRTGINPARNAVTVKVAESTDSYTLSRIRELVDTVDVRAWLKQLPDEAFNLHAAGCTAHNSMCDRPLRGGQQIWATATPDPYSEATKTCTAAFRANGGDGRKYVLTAGHCVKDAQTGAVNWYWMASHDPT